MDREFIEKIAELARLELSEEEKETFSGQLTDILGYVDKLSQAHTDKELGKHLSHEESEGLKLRPDISRNHESIRDIKRIAPDFKDGYFRVTKVIE